jgi:hypothetical protein
MVGSIPSATQPRQLQCVNFVSTIATSNVTISNYPPESDVVFVVVTPIFANVEK